MLDCGHGDTARLRFRPIIMTSIAMSAGMLPSALGVGEGGSFRAPMAIAVRIPLYVALGELVFGIA